MSSDAFDPQGGWSPAEAEGLYGAHRLALVRLAVLLLEDLRLAEEVVQDAFAGFLTRSRSLRDPDEALAYLRGAVVREARSAGRRRGDAGDGAPGVPPLAGRQGEVLDAVRRLPARQREVLVLRCWLDLTDVQVAEAVGAGRGFVAAAADRALGSPGVGGEAEITAALRSRADAVGIADLSPRELPDPAPRSRRSVLLGLAALAVAALVAAPFLTSPPADEPEPPPELEGSVRMDVNGDGQADVVHVDFNPSARFWTLSVDVAGGSTLIYQGLALNRPTLIADVDLDADFADEIAVHVSDDPATFPEFFRFLDGNLRRLRPPPSVQDYNGWVMSSPTNQWALRQGRLYTWQDDPDRSGERQVTGFWRWEIRGKDALVPGVRQQRCLESGADFPTECTFLPQEQREVVDADLDGDGVLDRVTLAFTASHDADTVAGFDVEVVVRGSTLAARGPPGWRPMLVGAVSLGDDPGRQVVVFQENTGEGALVVFGLVADRLVRLDVPADPLLGAGTDAAGRDVQFRAAGNRLVTFAVADPASTSGRVRVEVWEWRVEGGAVVPTGLGELCVDPAAADLPEPC